MVRSEADDDDGDELERALGRSLDVLAAAVSQPGWESMDEEVVGNYEQTEEQLVEAMMAMREARQQLQAVRQDRKDHGPPRRGAEGAAGKDFSLAPTGGKGRTPQERKRTSRCFDCGEDRRWAGDGSCRRPGTGLLPPRWSGPRR